MCDYKAIDKHSNNKALQITSKVCFLLFNMQI
mgnify:CR=1 FL=1